LIQIAKIVYHISKFLNSLYDLGMIKSFGNQGTRGYKTADINERIKISDRFEMESMIQNSLIIRIRIF
jgi:hypothetical protein